MSFRKLSGNNIYEWKINLYDEEYDDQINSTVFSIDGYGFQVSCARDLYSKQLYHFRLLPCQHSIFLLSYTFSILDCDGLVFVTSKGKALSDGSEAKRMIFIIDVSYLKAWNLIKSGKFTVRFSLDHYLEGSHSTKDVEDTSLLEALSNDFSNFYEHKSDTDSVLRVSDSQFHVHRAVLSARSSVFSAMFHHDTSENRSGEVNISDVEATILGDILYYIYSGKIKGLTADTATSMYTVADKYDLLELRKKCLELLKQELTMDNFCEAALLAHTHEDIELEERVVEFIEEKLDDISESNTWQQFLNDKTLIASKLLTSALRSSKKKFRDITSK